MSKRWIIESVNELCDRTFSCSTLTNKPNLFSHVNFKTNSLKNPSFFSCWISEPNINKLNFSLQSFWRGNNQLLSCVSHVDFWRLVYNCKDFLCCIKTFNCWWTKLLCISSCESSKHDAEDTSKQINSVKLLWIFIKNCRSRPE